ncbi:MAG: hypothetical protein JWO04_1865 [Gammaproteobacteria bacterium]|nr:hypothetical protein [Gammaproteobacteria bacterium]
MFRDDRIGALGIGHHSLSAAAAQKRKLAVIGPPTSQLFAMRGIGHVTQRPILAMLFRAPPIIAISAFDGLGYMEIVYKFRADTAYYRAVIDRYYSQRPLLLRLPVQYGIFSLIAIGFFLWSTDLPSPEAVAIAAIIAVAIVAGLVFLTKMSILYRFKNRAEFGADAAVSISEEGVSASSHHVQGKWEWAAYPRSARFSDGILLLRAGVIRWLPDSAIQNSTPEAATALVGSKTELRHVA